MKKLISLAVAGVSLLSMSVPANAVIFMENHLNIAVSGGYGWIDVPDDSLYKRNNVNNTTYKPDTDLHHLTYGGHIGYSWDIIKHLYVGPTLAYYHNGEAEYDYSVQYGTTTQKDHTRVSSSDIDLTAKVGYHFDSGFETYAQAGIARVSQDIGSVKGNFNRVDNPSSSPSRSIDAYEPVVGVGLTYRLTNGFGISAGFEHVMGDDPSTSKFRNNADRGKDPYAISRGIISLSYQFDVP